VNEHRHTRVVCDKCRRIIRQCQCPGPHDVVSETCDGCKAGVVDFEAMWTELVELIRRRDPETYRAVHLSKMTHHEAQRVCLAAVEYDRALLMAAHEDLKARGLSAGVLSLPDKDPVLRATLGAIRRKRG
jgi:hypothetical protein